jgi:hypothetical protein
VALSDWVPVAQVASGISAAAALILTSCALVFTGLQTRRSRRTADLQALQRFADDANKREAALADPQDDKSREHAFNEFLNFLELYACAYNNRLFIGRGGKRLVRHKIIDSYVELEAARPWHGQFIKALDRATTFFELEKLIRRHRKEVERRREQMIRKRERNRQKVGASNEIPYSPIQEPEGGPQED